MAMLTKHFNRSEFACKCGCGFDTVDYLLLLVLEDLRDVFGAIIINSGYRCKLYNRAIGGGMFSQHKKGRAADVVVNVTPAQAIQDYLKEKYPDRFGIGCYDGFTHIDVRNRKARW
ncbi:hypothetical protein LCGC14_0351230 [marine sediment metagenome]|uniref:Peptidase M15A C-terminal domain-containing protein n=1 Tax=marine sediment metagenome TaxID=412755 RepID=A0A0F9TG82_9ZZZZ